MESLVFKEVPIKLNYVGKMKLLFDGNEQHSPICASHNIPPKTKSGGESPASGFVNDKRNEVSANVLSIQDSSTKNESESENLRNNAIRDVRNWDKRSGQQLQLTNKENEAKVVVSDLFVNETSFGACSNNENQPEYVECRKKNRVPQLLKQFEDTHHQVSALKSKNRNTNAITIPEDSNCYRAVQITSKDSNECAPKLSTVPNGHSSWLEEKNLEEGITTNEPHMYASIKSNRITEMNNLEKKSSEIISNEYRISLLEQIERDLDRMRQDGFLNDNIIWHHVVNDNTFLTTYVSQKEIRDSAISSLGRSTEYSSTASTLSCSLREYGEGIGIMDKFVDERANNESENYHNQNCAVRSKIQEYVENVVADGEVPTSNGDSAATSKRLSYIVDEIKSTERKYVEDLMKIVRDFIPYILLHPIEFMEVQVIDDLFACIKDILRHQMNFLTAIENFQDIDSIVETLISNNKLLRMYPNYFRNKPKTDEFLDKFIEIFKDMQEEFGDLFDLSAYLLIPIQRLGKYKLFLEKIEKEQKKLNIPYNQTLIALNMVKSQMSKGNTYVAIDSIKDSPFGECDKCYGSFVDREKFDKSKYMVFLFEMVVVFTTMDQTNSEIFHYHDNIKMKNLNITTFDNNFTIILIDSRKCKSVRHSKKYGFVLEAKTEKKWMQWKENLSFYRDNKSKGMTASCDSGIFKWVWNCQG